MPRTTVPSGQIRDESILIDDLRDFSPEDGGGLNLTVRAGRIRNDNTVTDKNEQTVALTNATTNYVEIDTAGVATSNTVGFTTGRIPIATVVTAGGAITTITDKRTWVNSGAGGGGGGANGWTDDGTVVRLETSTDKVGIGTSSPSTKLDVSESFRSGTAALTDAATIATNAALGNQFTVTLAGNRTLGNPTNPSNRQKVTWILKQDSTGGRTITLDTKFRLGTDIVDVTLSTTPSAIDYMTAIYDSTDDKWDVVAFVKGY